MIDCEVALPHHFFEVAITEGIAQIQPQVEKDDLGLIVSPFEEIGFGHRQTSEEESGSGQSTIIDTRHPFFCNTTGRTPTLCGSSIYWMGPYHRLFNE